MRDHCMSDAHGREVRRKPSRSPNETCKRGPKRTESGRMLRRRVTWSGGVQIGGVVFLANLCRHLRRLDLTSQETPGVSACFKGFCFQAAEVDCFECKACLRNSM